MLHCGVIGARAGCAPNAVNTPMVAVLAVTEEHALTPTAASTTAATSGLNDARRMEPPRRRPLRQMLRHRYLSPLSGVNLGTACGQPGRMLSAAREPMTPVAVVDRAILRCRPDAPGTHVGALGPLHH